MIIHLCLPLIYLFGYSYFALVVDASFNTIDDLIDTYPPFYYCVVLATLLVISAFTLVYYWSLESWKFHPFVKKVCTTYLKIMKSLNQFELLFYCPNIARVWIF